MFHFCMDCAYLSVNKVNGVGKNSNFSSQLREDCTVRHPLHTKCLSAVYTPLEGVLRERPFDFYGGGGGWKSFGKTFP